MSSRDDAGLCRFDQWFDSALFEASLPGDAEDRSECDSTISTWKKKRHTTAAASVSGTTSLRFIAVSSSTSNMGPSKPGSQRLTNFSLGCYKIIMKGCWLAASIMSLSEDFLRVKLKTFPDKTLSDDCNI